MNFDNYQNYRDAGEYDNIRTDDPGGDDLE